jgi:hypothetical protein
MFTALNLRRLLNSTGKNVLKAYLEKLAHLCFAKMTSGKTLTVKMSHCYFTPLLFHRQKKAAA